MKELLRFCRAKGFPNDVINEVSQKYDFSATQNIGFVHSIGGGHVGEPALRTGVCSLAKAVDTMQLKTKKSLKIDYVVRLSSIGFYVPVSPSRPLALPPNPLPLRLFYLSIPPFLFRSPFPSFFFLLGLA